MECNPNDAPISQASDGLLMKINQKSIKMKNKTRRNIRVDKPTYMAYDDYFTPQGRNTLFSKRNASIITS